MKGRWKNNLSGFNQKGIRRKSQTTKQMFTDNLFMINKTIEKNSLEEFKRIRKDEYLQIFHPNGKEWKSYKEYLKVISDKEDKRVQHFLKDYLNRLTNGVTITYSNSKIYWYSKPIKYMGDKRRRDFSRRRRKHQDKKTLSRKLILKYKK